MININWKFKSIIFLIFIVFITIVTRIFYLSVINYDSNSSKKAKLMYFDNRRLSIVDKNGIIIASDIKTKTLYLNKYLIENPKFIAENLSKILNLDYNFIYSKITNSNIKSKYILIKRHLLPKEEKKVKELPVASIVFEDDLLRYYPHNNLFSHIVGYTDIDKIGIIGIEEYYNSYLCDMSNKPLRLTLDIRFQDVLRTQLLKAKERYSPNFLVGIITEIKTGNVLALVSLPDFNPNDLNDRVNTFNYATYGNFELGSVFKIFNTASGLQNNVISKNTNFDVTQDLKYGSFTIKDVKSIKNKATINTGEVFALSSNIGTIQIARKIGIDKQVKFFENLGLLEKLNIDINQVVLPLQPRKWREINLITIAYGYGIAVSPLHVVSAANAIINNGHMITPRFSYEFNMQKKRNVIDSNVSDIMREFFMLTTTKGTGKLAYVDGYRVGGKTGTAEKVSKDGYKKGEHMASFFGAFPMEDPEYSIFIVVDRPKSSLNKDGTGGIVAAKITNDIILNIIPFINIKPM